MRILIVDPEYLVAMEAERILCSALVCAVQIGLARNFPVVLESRNFDVVVIDTGLVRNADAARRLQAARSGVVFTTLGDEELAGLTDWPGVGVVSKPFDEYQLIAAVRNAARD